MAEEQEALLCGNWEIAAGQMAEEQEALGEPHPAKRARVDEAAVEKVAPTALARWRERLSCGLHTCCGRAWH